MAPACLPTMRWVEGWCLLAAALCVAAARAQWSLQLQPGMWVRVAVRKPVCCRQSSRWRTPRPLVLRAAGVWVGAFGVACCWRGVWCWWVLVCLQQQQHFCHCRSPGHWQRQVECSLRLMILTLACWQALLLAGLWCRQCSIDFEPTFPHKAVSNHCLMLDPAKILTGERFISINPHFPS